MNYNKTLKLLISIIICEIAGVIGSGFTLPEIDNWYKNLNKPIFTPPSWLFGPIWTAIFVLMGISLYLVWSKKWEIKNEIKFCKEKVRNLLLRKFLTGHFKKINIILIFILQLILNIFWSIIFFGMHLPGIAFFEILILWIAIIFMIILFYRVSKTAALLLIPYIIWVSFAAFLNYYIWILN